MLYSLKKHKNRDHLVLRLVKKQYTYYANTYILKPNYITAQINSSLNVNNLKNSENDYKVAML